MSGEYSSQATTWPYESVIENRNITYLTEYTFATIRLIEKPKLLSLLLLLSLQQRTRNVSSSIVRKKNFLKILTAHRSCRLCRYLRIHFNRERSSFVKFQRYGFLVRSLDLRHLAILLCCCCCCAVLRCCHVSPRCVCGEHWTEGSTGDESSATSRQRACAAFTSQWMYRSCTRVKI